MRQVILCDEQGNPKGTASIEEAHTPPGNLHKAFSVFVFRNGGEELLMQQRTKGKLFGLLWSNTCCSHPQEEANLVEEAKSRLEEECGFTCPLTEHSSFVYRAKDTEGKGVEHEYDTILVGDVDDLNPNPSPNPSPNEVTELKWINVEDLQKDIKEYPGRFAPWFPTALRSILPNQQISE